MLIPTLLANSNEKFKTSRAEIYVPVGGDFMEQDGKTLERKEFKKTKTGIILTSNDGKIWQLDYPVPEGFHRYGATATAERVAMFFLLLGMRHSLEEADKIAFMETKTK